MDVSIQPPGANQERRVLCPGPLAKDGDSLDPPARSGALGALERREGPFSFLSLVPCLLLLLVLVPVKPRRSI